MSAEAEQQAQEGTAGREENLLEIWGDTVDSRHLIGSLLLGAGIAAPSYLAGSWFFARVAENPDVGRTYALLVGLAGCMVGAVVAALLFKPKRIVTESEGTAESRRAAMDTIEAEVGALGDPEQLPQVVQDELHQLGLFEDLKERHLARVNGTLDEQQDRSSEAVETNEGDHR